MSWVTVTNYTWVRMKSISDTWNHIVPAGNSNGNRGMRQVYYCVTSSLFGKKLYYWTSATMIVCFRWGQALLINSPVLVLGPPRLVVREGPSYSFWYDTVDPNHKRRCAAVGSLCWRVLGLGGFHRTGITLCLCFAVDRIMGTVRFLPSLYVSCWKQVRKIASRYWYLARE
jgi:hypothetical protein